jgi:N-acyl-D-aspartate/D-glutamate deacylase
VLIGNCSLGLVPMRPELVDEVSKLFCYIEDMPRETFALGIPWTWERYAEYRDAMNDGRHERARGPAARSLRAAPVRDGDRRVGARRHRRRARADRRAPRRIRSPPARSASRRRSSTPTRRVRPVPSRLADAAELEALVEVLGNHRRGLIEFIPDLQAPGGEQQLIDLVELCGRYGVVSTTNTLVASDSRPQFAAGIMALTRKLRDGGSAFWPQMSPRTIDFRLNWETSMVFMNLSEWHKIPNAADDAERAHLLRSAEWRDAARAQWDACTGGLFPAQNPARVRFIDVTTAELEPWLGKTLADLTAARGGHPSGRVRRLDPRERPPARDPRGRRRQQQRRRGRRAARRPRHRGRVERCRRARADDVRGRRTPRCSSLATCATAGDLTVEQAVHELSGKHADVFGFHERGHVEPGKVADLTVFALEELHWDDDVFVHDLPDGSPRLRRPPGGYRYTLAAAKSRRRTACSPTPAPRACCTPPPADPTHPTRRP